VLAKHPVFPAPSFLRVMIGKARTRIAPREGESMRRWWTMTKPHSLSSSSAKADDPVRRGLSAQPRLSLEYWIARSSRATTAGMKRPQDIARPAFTHIPTV